MMDYPIVIVSLSKEDGGGFQGFAVDLKGCLSDGETQEDALKNTKNAIAEWLDECIRLGRDIPKPGSSLEHAARERKGMIDAIKALADVDDRMDSIADQLEELKEMIQNEAEWSRFASVTRIQNRDNLLETEGRC